MDLGDDFAARTDADRDDVDVRIAVDVGGEQMQRIDRGVVAARHADAGITDTDRIITVGVRRSAAGEQHGRKPVQNNSPKAISDCDRRALSQFFHRASHARAAMSA
jgi:hypothetical protein